MTGRRKYIKSNEQIQFLTEGKKKDIFAIPVQTHTSGPVRRDESSLGGLFSMFGKKTQV